ncbi:MAG: NFACT family protein [Desulfuromonas sp.]|nr:NFACT family protein [Desulfuromonas sp.]
MDCFFLQALIRQLQPLLQGAIVNKIYQPQADMLILRLWNGRGDQRLLISIAPPAAHLLLTDLPYRNPIRPPRFCQLLRARLKRLVSLTVSECDRVVVMRFTGQDERDYQLIAELFGREANVHLVDDQGMVVDSLRRGVASQSRDLSVGKSYQPLACRGDIPLTALFEQSVESVPPAAELSRFLQQRVSPMSKAVAQSLANEAKGHAVDEVVGAFVHRWQQQELLPCSADGVLTMTCQGDQEQCSDLNQYAQRFYQQQSSASGNAGELEKVVKKALKRLDKRLGHIDQEVQVCEQAEEFRQQADLLLAHRHLLKRGMTEIEVVDYYQQPPAFCRIELDSAKTPQQNIEVYFKRYRKAKRGLEHCQRRWVQTGQEIEWLEQIAQQLDDASEVADLEIVREELIESGYYRPQSALQRDTRRQSPSALVNRTLSPGGWTLLWGRNNKTNDYVSKQLLKPRDLWFHAHNIPGCHLVLKSDGADVSEEDLLFAASIAAAHSRGGKGDKVEVMYTTGKHVKRLKGAPLGLVTVDEYQTLRVTPRFVSDSERGR